MRSRLLPWLLAARPKTLPAAIVPVLVGAACAAQFAPLRWGPMAAALTGAVLLQIGSNFANDVYDHEKGADTSERVGPTRAVQAGWISPRAMKRAMALVFALAIGVGLYLTWVAGPWIVVIGVASIAAAIAYTGGPYPLGYHGLGELFVMIFFGFVAVGGTAFVNLGHVPELALWCAIPIGALASAILVVNNVRDEVTDRATGKRTLVVRFGRRMGLFEHALLLLGAYVTPLVVLGRGLAGPVVLLPLVSAPWAVVVWRRLLHERGANLNPVLAQTALLLLLYGVLASLGLAWEARDATL